MHFQDTFFDRSLCPSLLETTTNLVLIFVLQPKSMNPFSEYCQTSKKENSHTKKTER